MGKLIINGLPKGFAKELGDYIVLKIVSNNDNLKLLLNDQIFIKHDGDDTTVTITEEFYKS